MSDITITSTFDLADRTDRLVLADLLVEQGRNTEAALLREEQVPVRVDAAGRLVIDTEALVATVRKAYDAATGAWTGCEWTQPFEWRHRAWLTDDVGEYEDEMEGEMDAESVGSIDLDGEIRDARREAKSRGWSREDRSRLEEVIRTAYESARSYAGECESAAAAAEDLAAEAMSLAERFQWAAALEAAQEACRVESQFGGCPTWRPLGEAIEEVIEILDSLDD